MNKTFASIVLGVAMSCLLAGCGGSSGGSTTVTPEDVDLDATLNALFSANGMEPVAKPNIDEAKVTLGEALFFDKELSGNRNISCSTCHTPEAVTADDLSLSIGEGGEGRGHEREAVFDSSGTPIFIARKSPTLFSRGEFKTMFWDGRVEQNEDGSFLSPAGDALLPGLDNALAVVEMFPFTDRLEMRGQPGDNELADINDDDFQGIWSALLDRLLAIPEYVYLFYEAYPDVPTDELTFAHAANAIAAFEIKRFTLSDSPFDRYVAGDTNAMDKNEVLGGMLFYGKANCATCHSGPLLTDELFHNRVVPQLGPGKGHGPEGTHDFGRGGVSGDPEDNYKFRTPPLRNVAKQKAFMHDGAFTTLEGAVRHCMDPVRSAQNYDPTQLRFLFEQLYRPEQIQEILAAADENEIQPVLLSDEEVHQLIEFLRAMTTDSLDDLKGSGPDAVPSGLTLED